MSDLQLVVTRMSVSPAFDSETLIQEFEFNYGLWIDNASSILFYNSVLNILFPIGLLTYFCFEKPNLIDYIHAHRVAVTKDGIRFIVDKHPSSCRCTCFDIGRVSKTVPFDKITDCDLVEPAGADIWCCGIIQVPRVLSVVNIDTASSNGSSHELSIKGLKQPKEFKELVWKVKREGGSGDTRSMNPMNPMNPMQRVANSDIGASEMVSLLKSMDDKMATQNKYLKIIAEK